ncbi:hypothetical protein PanWU01x14_108650 [Parasponia andersonii]|uniref:Uncharacterized protein n=1 Tax=Parasponia andersonii TaxID=3476 RepID=A0A2P5D011_PARAD|nr:hypothetical protein PanWU01x14_108650 [Parasponia andersonii]
MTRAVAMIDTQVIINDESHHEESSTSRRTLDLFIDADSSEEENREWINEEESQDNTCESSPFKIQIIMSPPFIEDHIYDDPIWPTPLPPLLTLFIQAYQTHVLEPREVEHMSRSVPCIAKLEGVQK